MREYIYINFTAGIDWDSRRMGSTEYYYEAIPRMFD